MKYLSSFTLPKRIEEDDFLLNFPPQLEMTCYENNNAYPFKIFPEKELSKLTFEPITVFYGSNGSGKSTLLNLIARKLGLASSSLMNYAPCLPDYLEMCHAHETGYGIPKSSAIITSDDVFDYLQDIRAINEGINKSREELFIEYQKARDTIYSEKPFRSFDDLEELKRQNEAKRKTKSQYVKRRVPKDLSSKSNGESAYIYFTEKIRENALYLIDEPENSLSPKLQKALTVFIEEAVRFYGCQIIIATHSPFLLSLKGAKIYDLDSVPVSEKKWHELENIRLYYELFKNSYRDFDT